MMNSNTLFHEMVKRITIPESKDEIHAIVYMILRHQFSLSRTDIMIGRAIRHGQNNLHRIDAIIDRLNFHEPVQYILNEAEFWGRKFFVDPSVLIPRPETEELVKMVLSKAKDIGTDAPNIVDIGTGSGCIGITISLEMPEARIFATDVSKPALLVAQQNSQMLGADVEFREQNLLTEMLPFRALHVVVSNPPYIPLAERGDMAETVHAFEPHNALFVPDDDHLLFYRALADRAWEVLIPEGLLAVEINERFGANVSSLFFDKGYADVQVLTDLSKKDRMVIARKPVKDEFEVK